MVIVELGPRCNNRCVFCAQAWERDATAPVVALPEDLRGERVGIVGGEPTIQPELVSIVAAVRARGAAEVIVQTNGRRLSYGRYVGELLGAGVTGFDVSLQGSTGPMHDYHTRVQGSFGQTARGIRNARGAGVRVVVSTVVTRSNYRHLAEVVEVARALGAGMVRLRAVKRVGAGHDAWARLMPRPELARPSVRMAVQAGQRLGVPVVALAQGGDPIVDWVGGPEVEAGEQGPRGVELTRARPARGEDRTGGARTGEALRDILPGLFGEEGG